MSCDLQRLFASAADLPAAAAPRVPSVGERIMQDLLRLDADTDGSAVWIVPPRSATTATTCQLTRSAHWNSCGALPR